MSNLPIVIQAPTMDNVYLSIYHSYETELEECIM